VEITEPARGGGIGTLTRPPAPPRRAAGAPGRTAPAPGVRRPRQAPPPRKRAAPRTPAPERGTGATPLTRLRPGTAQRMPFILLLFGLLGGALISVLVISTTLAEGSFRITNLQAQNSALARQRQELQDQVAYAQSAGVIEQRAYKLGMRPVGELMFLNLKTGKIETDAGTGATAAIDVPGYTP
jgi:hypothetical protein